MIFIPLFLTLFFELSIWKLLNLFLNKFKQQYLWLSIIAINLITNPTINIFLNFIDPKRQFFILELSIEILVIITESLILYLIYKKNYSQLLLLSTIINIFSYTIGLLIFTPTWL